MHSVSMEDLAEMTAAYAGQAMLETIVKSLFVRNPVRMEEGA